EGTIKTSQNSIGIAISQDGQTIAVAEYKPGGITLIDTKSFSLINKIPAETRLNDKLILSRVTGLVDGLDNTFICALMDSDEIWELAKNRDSSKYEIRRKFKAIAKNPFDALITPEGRYYITGHFKSDRISLIDLWSNDSKAKPILFKPISSSKRLPTKMVHMESWAVAGSRIYIPSADEQRISVISSHDFSYKGSISLIGSPVYAMVHPGHKELWVTFSGDEQDGKIQIISTITMKTIKILEAGKRIYHMAFSPRGDRAFVSSNESNELLVIHCADYSIIKKIPLKSPSGIFGVWRAFQIGL
ncbi:MAG TPA: protein nirF, partial [Spirochaetes bacterium]|nr:protein nirF [Spirochaetota bacterium]